MKFFRSYRHKTVQTSILLVVCFTAFSVLIGIIGFFLKAEIVKSLPYQNEKAERPTRHATFLDTATDSWGPMKLALAIHRGPHGDELYGRLKEFQLTDDPETFPEAAPFKDGRKFQYPLTSLIPMEFLERLGFDSIRNLNTINLFCFITNILVFVYLCLLVFNRGVIFPLRNLTLDHLLIAVLAGGVAFTFYPNVAAVTNGNVQMWMNLLFTFSIIAWIKDKRLLSGILIAFICGFKPQLAPLVIWAALWKQWSFCKGILVTGVLIGLTSVAIYGWHNNWEFINVLSEVSKRGSMVFANESVNGVIHRLIEGPSERSMIFDPGVYAPYIKIVYLLSTVFALSMFVLAFLPAVFKGNKEPGPLSYVAIAVCFTLASPMIWNYHFGVLLPVYALALKQIMELTNSHKRNRMCIFMGISWVLCASYMPMTRLLYDGPWTLLSAPRFYGALILLYVVYSVGVKIKFPEGFTTSLQSSRQSIAGS